MALARPGGGPATAGRTGAPRVAGIDPGTVSFGLCVLDDGVPVVDASVPSAGLGADPAALVAGLEAHGPYDLVLGPSGYGLPLTAASDVGPRELALMILVRADQRGTDAGIAGMRTIVRALVDAGLPLVFGPGVIHLPTVPARRKWNRIDLGTADKVASAALCISDQAERLAIPHGETSFVMLELGGAFTAALAVDRGAIVDGTGGSSGPIGARACGALDAEVAYLLGGSLSKATVFSGGAIAPRGEHDLSAPGTLERLRGDPARREAWLALVEGAAKAVLSLRASVPHPREILVTGRVARAPGVHDDLAERLGDVAPVRRAEPAAAGSKAAARGAALLADGLAGGRYAPLVEALGLRGAAGTVLDHLRIEGADAIRAA
jgi:predicted butyrate kinase (DUF1464 family)